MQPGAFDADTFGDAFQSDEVACIQLGRFESPAVWRLSDEEIRDVWSALETVDVPKCYPATINCPNSAGEANRRAVSDEAISRGDEICLKRIAAISELDQTRGSIMAIILNSIYRQFLRSSLSGMRSSRPADPTA